MSKIPFKLLPASWGLKGKAFDVAKAHYELTGMELELRLAELDKEGVELARAVADIQHKYGQLSEYDWMKRHIEIATEDNPTEREVELTKLDIEVGKLEKRVGEKKIADLLGEPWVAIVNEGLDQSQGPNGFYFEFDWNDAWIQQLRAAGYQGLDEEEIMELWFTDVCREQVSEPTPLPPVSSIIYDR